MGYWYKPSERAHGITKTSAPPVWEITIQEANKTPYKLYAGTKKAEKYFRAGFPIKMKTTVGNLKNIKK